MNLEEVRMWLEAEYDRASAALKEAEQKAEDASEEARVAAHRARSFGSALQFWNQIIESAPTRTGSAS